MAQSIGTNRDAIWVAKTAGAGNLLRLQSGGADAFVINNASNAFFGKDLTGDARAGFIDKMRADPKNYVAQELVRLSQAPVWKPGASSGLSACAIGLRVFACATPNGYVVMPGGLTRVATGSDSRIINMQRGGGSKDTWIQASAHVEAHGLLKRATTSWY